MIEIHSPLLLEQRKKKEEEGEVSNNGKRGEERRREERRVYTRNRLIKLLVWRRSEEREGRVCVCVCVWEDRRTASHGLKTSTVKVKLYLFAKRPVLNGNYGQVKRIQ